ncbi:pro-sigmaK processing inhibitor BofA family protein [Clostridium frigidicarnis]|uniref:Inhibitor of the pro-sigma K processing machinery n=1 Tax=Clostridium frigidicarnis TaxID=84698 RepID=A0A1I1B9R3_9CLOT|nr:pro-sigmaK processing inhibitor BofA family protein [Clostridium frigidicarnis]SFB46981.1 inhibitor of the pro-sigma K processing machinery [Clostridium frigidicarnis]
MDALLSYVVAIILLFIVVKIFAWPIKIFIRLCVNGILGAVLLWIVNFFGATFGITIGINAITALIAGFFGVPGVIFLIIYKMFL